MRKKFKNGAGFTTFELLVVIFIVALLSSILIANIRKGEGQYRVRSTVQQIAQDIRRVQDMALNSFDYDSAPDVGPPPRYGIHFSVGIPGSYIIFADKDNSKKYQGSVDGAPLESISIENNMEIDSICKKKEYENEGGEIDAHITFTLPDGFTTVDPNKEGQGPPQEAMGIIIIIKKVNGVCPQDCKSITIEKTGKVSVGDWVNCSI